ncbi:MAG: carboxypeptidase-like regulatory domain-containing protein [Nitrospiraceae bacterium]|nr:carboxypeptidase-like regulatory domain-containing protein [Nitrospiraceae bacterium]
MLMVGLLFITLPALWVLVVPPLVPLLYCFLGALTYVSFREIFLGVRDNQPVLAAVTGVVRDEQNAMTLPGVTVTVEGSFNGALYRAVQKVEPTVGGTTLHVVVIGNDGVPSEQDRAKADLMRSWGYSVLLIAGDSSNAVYDAAFAQADVVYFSEDGTSSAVGNRLVNLTVGVVCEEQAYGDDLKMNTGGGTFNGSRINVINNSHPVTTGLPLGLLAITDSNTEFCRKTGTIAPGATRLATRETSSEPTLTLIDTGQTLTDSSAAPGRRVMLPWGGNSFDFNKVNANGRLLMRQAIEWGRGARGITQARRLVQTQRSQRRHSQ